MCRIAFSSLFLVWLSAPYSYSLSIRGDSGDPEEAVERFEAAVSSNPDFSPARFQLGRAQVALGRFDSALNDFHQLVQENGCAHSMAYVGYCFNLKRIPVAAIPWYERAVSRGYISSALYNNLGASYLDAQTHLSYAEGLQISQEYLFKALQLDDSTIVRMNLLRLSIARSKLDSLYNPWQSWMHAKAMLDAVPDDPLTQVQLATWYQSVLAFAATRQSDDPTAAIVGKLDSNQRQLLTLIKAQMRRPSASSKTVTNDLSSSVHRYFLEP